MKPTRSLLFVPGHRKTWAAKAVAAGADAIILDLEDSVPADKKAETRHIVAETIGDLAKNHPQVGVYVRLNALETGLMGDDLEAVAIDGCDGFLPPKTYGARDVIQIEALVDHFERKNGVAAGKLEFVLSLETAQAYAECEAMIKASARCATLFAGTARDADVSRSVGFEFTPVRVGDDLSSLARRPGDARGGQRFSDRRIVAGSQGHRWRLELRASEPTIGLPRHGGDPPKPRGDRQ